MDVRLEVEGLWAHNSMSSDSHCRMRKSSAACAIMFATYMLAFNSVNEPNFSAPASAGPCCAAGSGVGMGSCVRYSSKVSRMSAVKSTGTSSSRGIRSSPLLVMVATFKDSFNILTECSWSGASPSHAGGIAGRGT